MLNVPKALVVNQFKVFLQVGLVSSVSFLSMRLIKFEKLLIFLMQNKWIGAYLGYPILLALNSVKLLKSEFEKIKLNVKMRKLAPWQRINLIFPLLVFAIRHADRGALSLITRGLNEEKFYYFEVDLKVIDKIIILLFCLIVLVCTAI
jgi:energy-coupling factor transporter transmembrane protein EcfT